MSTLKSRKLCVICQGEIDSEKDMVGEIESDPVHWFCLEAELAYEDYQERMGEINYL